MSEFTLEMLGLTLALILLKPYSVRVKIPAGMADMIVAFQSGLNEGFVG